jgi:DHA2 family multidrug resistance protein
VNMFVDEPQALIDDRKTLLEKGLSVDIVGFILVALFFGCLEVTLDRGQVDDWFASPFITTTAIVAAASLFVFVPWELTRDDPIVPIAMFGRRNFGIASLFLMLTGVIVFGSTLFIPQLLQQVMGYTATDAGLALTAGGVATFVAMPVVGILSGKVDARFLIGGAFVIEGLALLNMSHLDTNMSFKAAALARTYQSVGLPFLFVPISAIAYVGLKPSENNQASALMNVARNLGGTLGISTVQTMLARRSQWHQARLVETLNPLNPSYVEGIGRFSRAVGQGASNTGHASTQVLAALYRSVQRQALMLSYVDVFHLLAIVVLGAVPLVFLLRANKGGAPAGAGA